MKISLVNLTQLSILLCYSNAANILLLSPIGSKSHLNGYMGMLKQLTDKGHQFTVVSAYGSSSKKSDNIRYIVLPSHLGASSFLRNVFTSGPSAPMMKLLMNSPIMCTEALNMEIIQNLKKEHFDFIILSVFFSDCFLSLVHHFKVPFAYISPGAVIGFLSESTGNPYYTALSGNVLLEGTPPFGYFYRLKATILDALLNGVVKYYTHAKTESLCRQEGACPPDMPSFVNIRANASLTISNSVKLLRSTPVPDMPHVIYGGGGHCAPGHPLPKDLEKWVRDSAENGFIFFSLGSAVTPSDMPEKSRKIFINVFGKLKYHVLWKWDKEMDDLPSNVKLGKWLPQQDILAHPKLLLFISHGGHHSVMETTYHGARILGMPIMGDQYINIQEGVSDGWAEALNWEDLTEETLEEKIHSAINNKHMKKMVAKRARIMNDQSRPPREEVAYWIEYVLRHNGAPHLRSPVHHMPFFVLYNLDVWLSIMAFMVGLLLTFYFTLKALIRRCLAKSKPANRKKKKQ